MARTKKEYISPELQTYDQRMASMRTGRIDKDYLTNLIMAYKFKKSVDKTFPMPRELAEVGLIIIDKTIGGSRWRGYTENWKEDMRGRAIEHFLKYLHGFNPEKMALLGKNADPYYYIGRMVSNACIQSWRNCKEYSDATLPMNDDILYKYDNSEEFNNTLSSSGWSNRNFEE